MPVEHKVCEQLPKEIGDFDLVILDEASQSDITALAALARGKRLLIVGDDEQVSPTAIGVTGEKVAELRTRFLAELRHRNMIDAESSIFDLAQMMFPQGQIMLREHFRSVAPIIAFSSQFYRGGLIPCASRSPPSGSTRRSSTSTCPRACASAAQRQPGRSRCHCRGDRPHRRRPCHGWAQHWGDLAHRPPSGRRDRAGP